jgi:uncharacterized protein
MLAATDWLFAIPALFACAAVSSVAGFAFSALALASAGWLFADPVAMVTTFLVCSIAIQIHQVILLRTEIDRAALLPFVAGGLLGTPAGTLLLLRLEPQWLTGLLGGLLLAWCALMSVRRVAWTVRASPTRDMVAGALGGVTGGFAAFPGAIAVPYLGLRGWSKERQRAAYQPYILAMQCASLACLALVHGPSRLDAGPSDVGWLGVAALAALGGSRLGIACFRRLSDRRFGQWVLALLAVSGAALLYRAWGL